MEIVITELLLIEHVKHCNKTGYRRFATLHEHNIDKVYRMTNYALGYPYFLGETFQLRCQIDLTLIKSTLKR